MELCIPDLTAKFVLQFLCAGCGQVIHGCRCEHALISANKIPGIVNQSLRNLPCSYIKLSDELSESGSACFSCRRQTH